MPRPPGTPTVDLTASGSSGSIDSGVFQTSDLQPSGTGVFNSFVQIQHNGTEQGYNTDHAPQFDEKNNVTYDHSVLLAAVPIVIGDGTNGTTEGVNYRVFRLDLNEANSQQYLSLDALQIWQEEAGGLTSFTSGAGFAGGHTNYLAYNLDAGGDHWVGLADRSHGSGQSDLTVLIPDSAFLNDAAHRYVTLYSQFGLQSGWASNGGFEEWGTSGPNSGPLSAIAVHKTATVPGGTADVVGEEVSYTIAVDNVGNTALTGLTVTDPYVSDLAAVLSGGFNSGDTNHDGKLSAGETWHYTAHHTVTQADLDNGGNTGEGTISNTVTADTDQTAPVSASASVEVVQRPPVLNMVKTPDVTFVDAAGQVIHYLITVQNTGNTTLTGLVVTDPQVTNSTPIFDFGAPILSTSQIQAQVLNGDYNAGDTNQNGFQDPGETFQYFDTGVFANVGDTNLNGTEDPGETFQYANVGDTNHNGVQDPGEIFQFLINHVVAGVDANHDGFNDGDTNHDGNLGVGETWQFAASYTITQADIDNGGVVAPGLTHDNTSSATTDQSAAEVTSHVAIVQNPDLSILKTVTSVTDTNGNGMTDAGDVIHYNTHVANTGNMTLTGVTVTDPLTGDPGGAGTLAVGASEDLAASYTLLQGDIDAPAGPHSITNTATADSNETAASSSSVDTPVTYDPNFTLVLTTLGYHDNDHSGSVIPGDIIDFSVLVKNTGDVTLTNLGVSDLDGNIIFDDLPLPSLAPSNQNTSLATHVIIPVETSPFDDTAIGQSDQVGNILTLVHVDFGALTAL
jgi:uncharacterized repeat protein (TIGR01451 family)